MMINSYVTNYQRVLEITSQSSFFLALGPCCSTLPDYATPWSTPKIGASLGGVTVLVIYPIKISYYTTNKLLKFDHFGKVNYIYSLLIICLIIYTYIYREREREMSLITSYYIPICWWNSLLTSPCLLGKLPISLFIHRPGPFQTDIHTIVFIYIYIYIYIV